MTPTRLDRVLVPVLLVSVAGAVLFGLAIIWLPLHDELVAKLLGTCLVLAIAAGFVLSATRLGSSGVRPTP